ATFSYRVRIDAPLENGTPVVARADVASQETAAFSLAQAAIVITASPEFADEHASFETQPPYEVQAGDRIDLRLRATNTGTTAAHNVNVAMMFASNVLPVRGATRLNGRPLRERKRDTFAYDIGTIDANETVDVTAQATVPAPQENGARLPLAIVLSWDGIDGDRVERRFERALTVHAQPAFASKRSHIQRAATLEVMPGEECEATILLFNEGTAAASDVLVKIDADAPVEDLRVFENKSRLPLEQSAVTLGTIESGAMRKLVVRGRVRAPQPHGSSVRVTATVHCRELGEVALGDVAWKVVSHAYFAPHRVTLALADARELRPNQLADAIVTLHNDGSDAARDVRLRLYVSPEARIESVEGATRERAVLHFGEIAPGGEAHARIGLRLLRGLAKAYPVTIDAVLTAEGTLPVQLQPLNIATAAEPDFKQGTIATVPSDAVEAGEPVEYTLYVRNGGDGPARNVAIRTDAADALVYVPNSTTVNDIPLRDSGVTSPLFGERGIVLSDVDPGVDATIRWREVVRANVAAGTTIARVVEIRYDGERTDEIRSSELHLRSAPAFATSIPGLPFGLDGVAAGPAFGRLTQNALTEERFVELPPATPVSAFGHAVSHPLEIAGESELFALDAAAPFVTEGIGTMLALSPERLQRTLRFLDEARFGGLVSHLFAVRAFMPDIIGTSPAPWLDAQRASLRELLDRLFIKLRLPNYVIAPRDLETKASRETLQTFLRFASSASGAPMTNGTRTVLGSLDGGSLRDSLQELENAP
ncbi:MAG: DUF11 domain-containing protein, partial [Candidatus Eremiobacteraeota bacterium]|nr:DUF11 domain-containing protein [Candidatus Eremiobacteraeota bacterium]